MTDKPIDLDPIQQEAVRLYCEEPFGIITGGPGTGKTTCLRAGLAEAQRRAIESKRPFVTTNFCAPTGKAACRLRDSVGQHATTLHRMLGLGFNTDDAFMSGGRIVADHVVVDEVSMVDTALMYRLVNAIDRRYTRLTLVGDKNQLPSVGPGQVLADMLGCGRVPTVELKTLHRAAQESWVCRNAPRILAGDIDSIDMQAPDFRFVSAKAGELLDAIVEVYEEELNELGEQYGYTSQDDLLDHSQIIVPQRVGTVGADNINLKLQKAVQGDAAVKAGGWKIAEHNFLDGDKVIQTKNDYTANVMNGETGIIRGSVDNGKRLVIRVDENERRLERTQTVTWALGYAITIHKSQGSQWPLTIVICHSAHSRMLSRRLFYTAVTRSSGKVVLIGDDQGFEKAVTNDAQLERRTQLSKLLSVSPS